MKIRMKWKENVLFFSLIVVLAMQFGMTSAVLAAEASSDHSGAEKENLTGIQIIDGAFCCFSEDGARDEEKTEELQEAAQKESDIAPLLELIGEPERTEYFGQGCWFGESGKESGEDGAWYYDNFVVYVYKTDNVTYYMGAEASEAEKTDFQETLNAVVLEQTAESDSSAAKLGRLFQYVEENYSYARKVGFEAYDGWERDYALEMLSDKAGSCYHFAALYAFLAKAATDCEVRICTGTTDGFSASSWQPHAWTEVEINGKWYAFDPNLDKYEADSTLRFYRIEAGSGRYDALYKAEETFEVSFDAEIPAEQETEEATEAESETEAEEATEAETETEEAIEAESETETEEVAEAESETEAEEAIEAESETEAEEAIEAESETEEETETEAQSTELEVTEEGEYVWTLDNQSGLDFTGARLEEDELTLTDADGVEHRFLQVDKDDVRSPILVMYGSFLSIKYTSAGSGKAVRTAEEGDELVFREPQQMDVIVTVYVRSGAGLDFDKISVADRGTRVTVIGETGKWYKISLKDGREGYISKVGVIKEASASDQGSAPEAEPVPPEPETVIVEDDGEYYRYERFSPAEDTIVEIDGEPCYVNAGGTVSEGWKVLDGQLYYSDKDGQVKCSETYQGIELGKDGAAVSDTNARLKIEVIQIVNSITDDTMTRGQKLSACWNYVTRGHLYYAGKYPDLNAAGWQRRQALDTLTSGSGNCYGFACAFAALAEGVGYSPEVVCGRVSGSRDGAADGMTRHSWVLIDGCCYDPEAQWAGWCPGIYGYGSYPVAHSVQKIVAF